MQSNRATLYESKVRRLAAQYYPNRRICSVECLHSSGRTRVYDVIFQNEPPVIVKLFPSASEERAIRKFSHERSVYGKLTGVGVPVPQILKSCEKSQEVGMPYCILTRLQGQPADNVLQHTNSWEDIKIFQALGTTLSKIHQIEAPWVGPVLLESVVPQHIDWWQYLASMLKRFASGGRLSGDKEQATQYLRQAMSSMTEPIRLTLVHNDYTFHNILLSQLVNSWEVSGILDVEWAFYGDAEWDLACFYWYLRQDYERYHQIFENFRSGYHGNCAELPVLQFEKIKVYMLLRMLALSQDYPAFGGNFNEVLQWQTW
ncbi:phosphotransferase family protein [Chloroflexota bacterium]